jgi:dipeptidyl-peptidase-4
VVFARSASGSDSVNALWLVSRSSNGEQMVLDPHNVGADLSNLTPEELRRRERAREGAGGVTTYACDADVTSAVTILGGRIVHVDLEAGTSQVLPIDPGVFDARLSPDGTLVAFLRDGALCVATVGGEEREIESHNSPDITWGAAEFIAAEEMGRQRGYWWSPDSEYLAAIQVDNRAVPVWTIADPAHPEQPAQQHRYPAAGSTNASVSLHIIDVVTGDKVQVEIPGEWEYINSVQWTKQGLIVQVQPRDQKSLVIHSVNTATGECTPLHMETGDEWVELVPGVPALNPQGQLVTCADLDGARRIVVDGTPVTPEFMQVRSVVNVGNDITFVANYLDTPWIHQAFRFSNGAVEALSPDFGVASVSVGGDTHVVRHSSLKDSRASFTLSTSRGSLQIASFAEEPLVSPNVRITTVGARAIPVAILTPRDGSNHKLPVLFDPYGGPHAQRVVDSNAAFATSQWFADQGFVVVVADNRGTPGKGSQFERDVYLDLAGPVIEDQLEVLDALAILEPRADLSRVGIRGWSFGGYLAALAVLRHSDRFHAAVAGAPVTDWRLYDTHYTERYLGNPTIDDAPYESTSLLNNVEGLSSALLIIHGLADDNVVAAHTLQLSSALLAAGKPHEVLPLSGVTHMTPQEVVAENLLLHQLEFLRRHLA